MNYKQREGFERRLDIQTLNELDHSEKALREDLAYPKEHLHRRNLLCMPHAEMSKHRC